MFSLRRLWLLAKPGTKSAMASMGGVGSTALARHIGSIADKTVREHAWSPAVYDQERNIRLGYMYGSPYNAVLSVFRRNYQQMHVRAMNANSPTPPVRLQGTSIEEYLERGVDEFHMERQFSNWTNPALSKHPVILIKYETLAESIGEVLQFFECGKPFPIKSRRTSWLDQPAHIRAGLERMYGALAAKIEAMPPVMILQPRASEADREAA
jgi:hypothetical protein